MGQIPDYILLPGLIFIFGISILLVLKIGGSSGTKTDLPTGGWF